MLRKRTISRRKFIQLSAMSAAGFTIAACAGAPAGVEGGGEQTAAEAGAQQAEAATAAASTSPRVITPPGPVPCSWAVSTPRSAASRRTSGDRTVGVGALRCSGGGGGSSEGGSSLFATDRACSPSASPTTRSGAPTATTSPTAPPKLATVPAYGDDISTVLLSVSIAQIT